jgi:PAS domain S-box-containing protein
MMRRSTRFADTKTASQGAASRQLTAIMENAVDAIITIDQRGLIQTFNRSAEKMFGYARHEAIGQNVTMLMPDPHRSEHDQYLLNYLRTGRARIIGIGRETIGRRQDGTVFPIELSVSEVLEGQRRTFTGMVRDISERRRLESEILEVSECEQRRIGHELHDGLCQQLAGIAFAVQSLQRTAAAGKAPDPAELRSITGLLQEAVRHARGLSGSLYPVDPQPNGLAVALTLLAANTAEVLNLRCEFQSPRPVEIRNPTTATHLYRIAQEAVRDAVRHGKADHIVIALCQRERLVTMSISDDGLGLSVDGRYRHGVALRLMQHRAEVIGASLQLRPGIGNQGVRVVCELQIPVH